MTLYHLYTVAGLILALALVFRLYRCTHAWELVDKTELPSKIEVLNKNWRPSQMSMQELLKVATVRATIVMRCSRCGAAKIIEMSND